jgi:fumarylacetoacetase
MYLPVEVKGFTDFSCSREHMLNAGEAATGVRSMPPGGLHFPIGYTGRASTVVVSGTPIRRPYGQFYDSEKKVVFGPSRWMDFELEMACIIGKPSKFGERVAVGDADEHIFGFVLLNDWSGESRTSGRLPISRPTTDNRPF